MRVSTHQYQNGAWSPELVANDASRALVLCFGASSYVDEPDPILEVARAFPNSVVAGCSSAGEIHNLEVFDETLTVAVAQFEATPIRSASERVTAATSADAGRSLARQLAAEDLRSVLVFSDGLDVNGSELVRGINEVLAGSVIVTGGLAADGDRFERTWVIVEGKPASGFVTAVGLYGDSVSVGHGSKGGWDIFGPERTVTRSEQNILYELDGRPALELYKEYLGELASGLPATGLLFPLALRSPGDPDKFLVRTILGVDDEANSLTFAGDVPQGHRAQLMQASFDRLVDGAETAAETALAKAGPNAQLSIAISCVGRRLVLGTQTENELEATMHVLPTGIAQVGFYSYGEISPYAEGVCDLHNQTMTLTTIAEN